MSDVQKYSGWEDIVVSLIPHEDYVKLAQFKGVEFWGNDKCLVVFIPPSTDEGGWEAHWNAKHCSGTFAYKTLKKCLAEFFKNHYNETVFGLTPLEKKAGIKMARLLGFRPIRIYNIEGKPQLLSYLQGEK